MNLKAIGSRIKTAREKKGLTQESVARRKSVLMAKYLLISLIVGLGVGYIHSVFLVAEKLRLCKILPIGTEIFRGYLLKI